MLPCPVSPHQRVGQRMSIVVDLTLAPHVSETVASVHAMHLPQRVDTPRPIRFEREKIQKLRSAYCARITTLYAPTPTLALKFNPSFLPGLAVVSKLSPLMKLGS